MMVISGPWLQLEITLGDLPAAEIAAILEEAGALSLSFEDAADEPILEPAPGMISFWSQTRIKALFPAACEMDGVLALLCARLGLLTPPPWRVEPVENRQWEREWLRDFMPMRFGERVWICPSAYDPPDPDAVNIVLDPGLAFGTGSHATTALCLNWLDSTAVAGTVIDFGCGSGILAITAAKLGASEIWAVDHDPQALAATRSNAELNKVAHRIHALGPRDLPAIRADFLIANILAQPLRQLATCFSGLVRPGGRLVLSGILEDQVEDVARAYEGTFVLDAPLARDGWACLTGTRKAMDAFSEDVPQ